MKRISPIMRVSPEFEDLVNEIEADFKRRYDAAPTRTKLTKLVAKRVKTSDLLRGDEDDDVGRTSFI